jgi:hypothetical protein
MDNQQIKDLCIRLMKAETEEEVISLLNQYGYWDNPDYWRFYGDQENNYSSAGTPKSVKEAVARFFEDNPNHELAGQIREWDNTKRREIESAI